jgi:hypothetical protein
MPVMMSVPCPLWFLRRKAGTIPVEIRRDSRRISKESLQGIIDPFYTKKTGGEQSEGGPAPGDPFAFLPLLCGLGDMPDMFQEALIARR